MHYLIQDFAETHSRTHISPLCCLVSCCSNWYLYD